MTATAANILSGKTAYVAGSAITGTMTNRGAVSKTLTTTGSSYTIPAGYHNGSGKVTATITNLTAANIATGKVVGGVTGTYKGLGSATAAQVLSGKTFSTASLSNASGTMTDNSAKTSTSSYVAGTFKSGTTGYVFATGTAGYYSASTYIRVPVTNLSAGNIKKGVTVGGVAGTYDPPALFTVTVTVSYGAGYMCGGGCTIYDNNGTKYTGPTASEYYYDGCDEWPTYYGQTYTVAITGPMFYIEFDKKGESASISGATQAYSHSDSYSYRYTVSCLLVATGSTVTIS